MSEIPLPGHVEKAIREAEERLTAELRELTGRDDLVAVFDRSPLVAAPEPEGWPTPAPLPEDYWESAE